MSLITKLKALPFGYNRDLQETKTPVIRVSRTVRDSIDVCTIAVTRMAVNKDAMLEAASDEFLFATDIVEHLVASGMPFRDAHSKVSEVVRSGKRFSSLSAAEWRQFGIPPSVVKLLNPTKSVRARRSPGGTSPEQVKARLK